MHSQTILVADRQTHVLNAITAKLQANGIIVATAGDGIEAYMLTREIQPDLVVVDYQMPRLSGPELCVKLACDPLTSHVPVVLMVAGGFDASAIPADNIARIIGKPFSPQLLLSIVQDLLAVWDRLPAGHLDRQDAGPTQTRNCLVSASSACV